MRRAVTGTAVASAVLVSLLLFPFLPGQHFAIAAPLYGLALLLGFAGIALVPAGLVWLLVDRRRGRTGMGPLLLVAPPLVSLGVKFAVLPHAVAWSRERAMTNATPFIAAIEAFRARTGGYPVSLASVHSDFRPGVVGVQRFFYEPSGDAYNLYFEQRSDVFGTLEFVIYNPLGRQTFAAHDSDLLEFAGASLELRRGFYASADAGRPNWKRFLFD